MSTVFHAGLPAPARPCTERDLDRRIAAKRMFPIRLVVVPVGGARIELTAIGSRTGDIAEWALETYGADAYVCVGPA